MMLEKDFEDVLINYPELIEKDLKFLGRQVSIGGKFVDLLFEDRFGHKLIIELKRGTIKRDHIAQLFDYEGYFLSSDNPNIRVMLIGNHVPQNLRNSLDHHGFEWREISISTLVEHLKNNKDAGLIEKFIHAEKQISKSQIISKTQNDKIRITGYRGGLPQINQASSFEELKEIIYIRSKHVPSCYMDKLLLENKTKTISRILEDDWWPYAKKIEDRHFTDISRVKKHLKFREDRGWEYEYSGNMRDPIVRLIGFKKRNAL